MLRTTVLLVLPYAAAAGQTGFSYPDFSSKPRLALVKDAATVQSLLRLTPAASNQRGAAWYSERQPVAAGFQTTFQFRITEPANNDFGGADGFAFVIQDRSPGALGDAGMSAGFATTTNAWSMVARTLPGSAAVFFDTHQNEELLDPSGNYIGVYSNGRHRNRNNAAARIAHTDDSLPVQLNDGRAHTVKLEYSPGRLEVYLDDLAVPVLMAPLNLAALLGPDGKAYVGFTAGTGGGFQNHDILSWSFLQSARQAGVECLQKRTWCTPARATVEERAPGLFHVVLPANGEEGASIANPTQAAVALENARGSVCWDPALRGGHGCNGVKGSSVTPTHNLGAPEDFLAPDEPAGALIHRTANGRTYFSINDRHGDAFADNEGYFEFDVRIGATR